MLVIRCVLQVSDNRLDFDISFRGPPPLLCAGCPSRRRIHNDTELYWICLIMNIFFVNCRLFSSKFLIINEILSMDVVTSKRGSVDREAAICFNHPSSR